MIAHGPGGHGGPDGPARPAPRPAVRGFGGGGFGGMQLPAQKSKDLNKTLRQLLQRLRPEWMPIAVSAALALAYVALSVIGPKIIGNATNVIFNGVIGRSLPAGLSKAQVYDPIRALGRRQTAEL